jgi:hypothetical protein
MFTPAFKALMSIKSTGSGAIYTLRDSQETDDDYNGLLGSVAGATVWTAGYSGTWTVKRTAFKGYRSADETSDTVTMEIWSSSGGAPDAKLGGSDSIAKSSIPLSGVTDWVYFDWTTGCDVTAATMYYLAVKQSGTNGNIYWRHHNDGAGSYYGSDNGTTWYGLFEQYNLFRAYTLD